MSGFLPREHDARNTDFLALYLKAGRVDVLHIHLEIATALSARRAAEAIALVAVTAAVAGVGVW